MKRIDDKNIVESLANIDKYEIKTTANDILNAYEKEKNIDEVPLKKKFNFPLFIKIAVPTLAACSIAAITIVSLNGTGVDEPPIPIGPTTSDSILDLSNEQQQIIGKQLNTLASFQNDSSKISATSFNKISTNSITTLDDDDDDDENNNYHVNVSNVIDLYDPYSFATINLINNKEFEFSSSSIENENFANILTLSNNEEVLKIEYNISIELDHNEFLMEGLLKTESNSYPVTIFTEKEGSETEVETIIEYSSTNVVKIEQENEPGKWESENSISYATYNSKMDAYDDDKFIEKFTYEYENEFDDGENEIEMEVEIETNANYKDSKELNLQVISHDQKSIYFEYEYESENPEIEIEDEWLKCTINDDNSRTYESKQGEEIRK